MKMNTFYCFIGPKSTVSGGLGGMGLHPSNNLKDMQGVNTEGSKPCGSNNQTHNYLKGINFDNVNLERK